MDEITKVVLELADAHKDTWLAENEDGWFSGLHEEVEELDAALSGLHDDMPEHELAQIASIAINWLRHMGASPEALRGTLHKHL